MNVNEYKFIVTEEEKGQRLDYYLATMCPKYSRSFLTRLIRLGQVLISGENAKPATLLQPEQEISLTVAKNPCDKLFAQADSSVNIKVIYQEPDFLIVNKPPALVVHPAFGNSEPTLADGLLACNPELINVGLPDRPGIVHRLDKDTSGVMVIAKNNLTSEYFKLIFSQRKVNRTYVAFTYGVPKNKFAIINEGIGRHPKQRHKMSITSNRLRDAKSSYQVLKIFSGNIALLKVKIFTGRTHQIRVHLASIGCPVLGDEVYGSSFKKILKEHPSWKEYILRQMLHARCLGFKHPSNGLEVKFRAPWPSDMLAFLKELLKTS